MLFTNFGASPERLVAAELNELPELLDPAITPAVKLSDCTLNLETMKFPLAIDNAPTVPEVIVVCPFK